jgi:hypothetical protein
MRELAVAAGADPGLTEDAVRSWFTSGLVRDRAADTRLVVNGATIVASAMLAPPAGYVLAGEQTPGRIRMNEIGTRRAWRRQGWPARCSPR